MKTKNYEWGVGQRKSPQYVFTKGVRREPYPQASDGVAFLRYEREVWREGRKPNRVAVGLIRAMGAQHFFQGCYRGAEND